MESRIMSVTDKGGEAYMCINKKRKSEAYLHAKSAVCDGCME